MDHIKKVAEGRVEYIQSLTLRDIENLWISEAFNFHGSSISATAFALGIGRSTLYRRLGEINGTDKKQAIYSRP